MRQGQRRKLGIHTALHSPPERQIALIVGDLVSHKFELQKHQLVVTGRDRFH